MKTLRQLRKEAGLPRCFGAFHLRFRTRNARTGPGLGPEGVASDELVDVYGKAFVQLTNLLEGPLHSRTLPYEAIEVLIVNVSDTLQRTPFMAATAAGVPFIVLPCRIGELTTEMEQAFAIVCAAHEGCHAYSQVYKPYAQRIEDPWAWFDEATAVWAEMKVSPGNPFTAEYFMHWCDSPERSLNGFPYWYGAGQFGAYLEQRYGDGFLTRVWRTAKEFETPLEAILALADVNDATFHEYSVASFFCQSGGGETIFAQALRRFGGRAFTDSFEPPHTGSIHGNCQCEPLSTHYFRFWGQSIAGELALEIKTPLQMGVRASLVRSSTRLERVDDGPLDGSSRIELPDRAEDYAVLVISNDGRSGEAPVGVDWTVTSR